MNKHHGGNLERIMKDLSLSIRSCPMGHYLGNMDMEDFPRYVNLDQVKRFFA